VQLKQVSLFTQEYKFDFKGYSLRLDTAFDRVHQVTPNGRKTFSLPKWFDKGKGVTYISCSAIKFDHPSGEDRYLVWPQNADAAIRGMWDGSKLHIYEMRGIKTLALYCADKVTLMRTWTPRPAVNAEPIERIFTLSCSPIGDDPGGNPDEPAPDDPCLLISQLPVLGIEPGVRPELPCVFGEPLAIENLLTLA